MSARSLRAWSWVHKWTSLVSMVFLLVLCLTGLPLIFHEEIDALTGAHAASSGNGELGMPMDQILANAQAHKPGLVPLYFSPPSAEHPEVFVTLGPRPDADIDAMQFIVMDPMTGQKLDEPTLRGGFMGLMYSLHVDLFMGVPGKLFLGLMGLLFVVAIVSGVVLYAPFMRRLPFGTVRKDRSPRTRWLDLHNMIGVVTLGWALVVGLTGILNTLDDLLVMAWQNGEMAEISAPYAGQSPPTRLGSLDAAVATALAQAPDMETAFIAFPGTAFSTPHHYAVYLHGSTPLTEHLVKPFLVEGATGTLTDVRELPWYLKALLLSQPLHFGNYGGLPLKIIWALLDLATIVVLGSGLYLWLKRRRVPAEARLAEELGEGRGLVPAPGE
ncbi:PepSY-associated TM helix domain-containing protein [Zavarzinia sp. CC-PAN008]|uniref:PepSY-associated TM helix domain-containing protein n=1 Tax=Zavarzinia sp. CC-PAN008 TaxID=3243332 RepID=UPI003F749059